jgi:hypothetical protein
MQPEKPVVSESTLREKHRELMRPLPGHDKADSANKPAEARKPVERKAAEAKSAPLIPSDSAKARKEILGWVAAEKKPAREYERLGSANPDTAEHNYRVSYAVNYALKEAGGKPGQVCTEGQRAAVSEKALWIITALRKSDAKIGTSESLILRDSQRYLYGSLGDAWLQKHVEHKYDVPKEVAPYLPGKVIDRGYEDVVKPAEMGINAVIEEITGKNPGYGRGTPGMPHSRPGGETWYDAGHARVAAMEAKTQPSTVPFITTAPAPKPDFYGPGHLDLGHGESVNTTTGEFRLGTGPKF